MYEVELKNVSFEGDLFNPKRPINIARLKKFSSRFLFGKSYLLYGNSDVGAWAISWMLGGAIEPQSGSITLDGKPYSIELRKRQGWLVRSSQIKKFGIWHQSVQAQVRHGLKATKNQYVASEADLIHQFGLSPTRYVRPLRQLSSEAWRASCAIGLANGKRIFCFPHIGILRPMLFAEYGDLWLGKMLNTLKSTGALVIVPTDVLAGTDGLFDEVISVV